MPSKKLTALAAGALLVATSSAAVAQTAAASALPAVSSTALIQGMGEGEEGSAALIIGGVLAAIGIMIWVGGDDDEEGDEDPVSP
jgi:hypothetical protein